MKNLSSISLALLAGALTFGACDTEPTPDSELIAEEGDSDALTPAALGFGDEWVAVEPGLWASWDELGNKKFLGLGEAGKAHAIASLLSVAEELESNLSVKDSADARAKLAELHDYITDIQASSSGEAAADELEFRCSFDISGFVDAYPITCGAAASASASFSHPCGSQKAYVKTFASASCDYDTKTHTCGPLRGDPVSCNSYASDTGNAPCSSYAIAQIYDAPGVNVYLYDHNSLRGACGTPTTTGSTTTSGSTSFNPTGGGGCNSMYVQCDPL